MVPVGTPHGSGRSLFRWSMLFVLGLLPQMVRAAHLESAPVTPLQEVVGLEILAARDPSGAVVISGSDTRHQWIALATDRAGKQRDVTTSVQWHSEPPNVLAIDPTGLATPLVEGEATLHATLPGVANASVKLRIEGLSNELEVDFQDQIVPLFTKLQCNSGGCHGKSGGQNGFALSLLGFEPQEDYDHVVKEGRGRRVFPAVPEASLLLTKAVGATPHGGGQRLTVDSAEYRLLHRWIRQGAPLGSGSRQLVGIEVLPGERIMGRQELQQLAVVARYADGRTEDITRLAQFDSNAADVADVSPTGLVQSFDQAGTAAVMVRYCSQVAVFRATIPLGAANAEAPPERNFIDRLVFGRLQMLGIPASPVCDDATFLRRVSIDLTGRIPTPDDLTHFLADPDPHKRDRAIDRLLDSDAYAEYFAAKWSAILRNKRTRPGYLRGTQAFHGWISDSLRSNKPYNQFVREILAASGEIDQHPPVAWYREVNSVEQQVEDTAQLFLGTRIQFARCHHHPFEQWSQHDYYALAAFFSQVARKPGRDPHGLRIVSRSGEPMAKHPKTGETVLPAGLGASPSAVDRLVDPRHRLVDWMESSDNRFFATALVNRYWKHLMGRGLVEPEDDIRVTNPPTNPELLDALARHFIDRGFDLKDLLRTICQSTAYQLTSEPCEENRFDTQNYARYYPKRLQAEVLFDAIDMVTGSKTRFDGLPAEVWAVQLPDNVSGSYFLEVFGRPQASSACECERTESASLAQSLHLLNSDEMQKRLAVDDGLAAHLAADEATPVEERITRLYRTVLSRDADQVELSAACEYLAHHAEQPRTAWEDLVWALLNTKEFLFNH